MNKRWLKLHLYDLKVDNIDAFYQNQYAKASHFTSQVTSTKDNIALTQGLNAFSDLLELEKQEAVMNYKSTTTRDGFLLNELDFIEKELFLLEKYSNENNGDIHLIAKARIYKGYLINRKKLLEKEDTSIKKDNTNKSLISVFSKGNLNAKQQETLLKELVKNKYLKEGTTIEQIKYIFGRENKPIDFKPLNWVAKLQDLKMFIDTFFINEDARWKKTSTCFLHNNNEIKIDSIKNLNPSHKDDPPSKEYFEKLKKEILQ